MSRVDSGTPVSVMLTAYSTTLLANGEDWTKLRIAVTDSASREITSATDLIRVYVTGDGSITSLDGQPLPVATDTAGVLYTPAQLVDGVATLAFRKGELPRPRESGGSIGHVVPWWPRDSHHPRRRSVAYAWRGAASSH